jgi:hypothetical protein
LKKNVSIALLLSVALLVVACTTPKNGASGVKKKVKEPAWVVSGSGIYESRDGKMFQGVGMANEYRSHSLLQAYSENRAKDDLKKVLEDFTAALKQGFVDSEKASGSDDSSDIYILELDLNVVRSATLDEAEVVELWLHPDGGKVYALVSVSLEKLMEIVKESKKLKKKFKTFVDDNAENIHEDLGKYLDN